MTIRVVLRPPPSGANKIAELVIHSDAQQWTAQFTRSQSEFGRAIAAVGDIDHDGSPDIAVGARTFNGSAPQGGQILVFHASTQGLGLRAPWVFTGTQQRGLLGNAAGGRGDVNGDGIEDMVVGAHRQHRSRPAEGQVLVFYGSNVLATFPNWVMGGSNQYGLFGCSVSIDGDFNGDGFSDVLVGASRHPQGRVRRGAAKIFYGSTNGPSRKPDWMVSGAIGAEEFGYVVAYAGDLNQDGCDEVLISSPIAARGAGNAVGRVALYLGSHSGPSTNAAWSAEGADPSQRFGESLALAGDINNDGLQDLLVGAPGTLRHGEYSGRVFLFAGSTNGFEQQPCWVVEGEHGLSQFGSSVSGAGDVNGDGFDDILIGSPDYGGAGGGTISEQGRAYLFLGTDEGPAQTPAWTADGGQAGARMGWCVSAAGDLNQDGLADFAVGAPFYDYGSGSRGDEGRVDVFYGSLTGYQGSNAIMAAAIGPASSSPSAPSRQSSAAIIWTTVAVGLALLAAIIWRLGLLRHKQITDIAIAAERARMARDLHDEVGPHIAQLTRLGHQGTGSSAESADNPPGSSGVSDTAREMARALEQAVWGLSPGKDSLEDLVSFLGAQAPRFFTGSKTQCVLDLPVKMPEHKITPEVRRNLPLVVKEILNNVAKHSNATIVTLSVKLEGSTLRLIIEDNGRGVPTQLLHSRRGNPGNGLVNIRTRMEELHGWVDFASHPPQGLRVALTLEL